MMTFKSTLKAAATILLVALMMTTISPVESFTAHPAVGSAAPKLSVLQSNRNADEPSFMEHTKKRGVQTALLSAALLVGTVFGGNIDMINASANTNQQHTPFSILSVPPASAFAEGSKVVGALKGSGLVFKDTLQIERFDDPKVQGVTLYISNFERPLTEKLSSGKNFFNDPSYASVACARTGGSVIKIADNINKSPSGEEVFEASRSLLFKTLRVQRVYDEEKKTVVYVSYNTRLDKGDDTNKSRFKSSLCAVNLE